MKLVICATGASGAIYLRRAIQVLERVSVGELQPDRGAEFRELHLVASDNASLVWRHELGGSLKEEYAQAAKRVEHSGRNVRWHAWSRNDFSAPFASGSAAPDAVLALPCSMSTLGRLAHGGGGDLIARAGEVALKERRPLVLVTRETPLSLVHLENMVKVTLAGARILPAVPSFYAVGPDQDAQARLDAAIDSVLARALDHVGLRLELLPRWGQADAAPLPT